MTRLLVCCIAIALLAPTVAAAGGLNLSWDDCGLSGRTSRTFACNTNDGVDVLVASFDPPPGITKLIGIDAVIEVITAAPTSLPQWWHVEGSGCRDGSLTVDTDFSALPSQCLDYWSGGASSTVAFEAGPSNSARMIVSCRLPDGLAGEVIPGNEYSAFRLILDHAHAVGTGACAGCSVAACLLIDEIRLIQPPELGDYRLCNPRDRNFVVWQGALPIGCPPLHSPLYCASTPTRTSTWGEIKTVYR